MPHHIAAQLPKNELDVVNVLSKDSKLLHYCSAHSPRDSEVGKVAGEIKS